jgi:hypothetical protein
MGLKPLNGILDVVTVISNPVRYKTRYRLYKQFEKHVLDSGARLTTVEIAYANREFEITSASNPRHVQLRSPYELWHKENMLNIGINRLPPDWEYVAWIDADLMFARPDWVQETIQQLQHYSVIQMFATCLDLDPNYNPFFTHKGFVYSYQNKLAGGNAYEFWHPGYAWAARREAIDGMGGLIDWAILGAADHHMATALIGNVLKSCHGGMSQGYRDSLLRWQGEADKHVRRNIGYMDGVVLHYWHGRKKDRNYVGRWDVLVKNGYDPRYDIKRDWQGVWQLTDRSIPLRDGIRNYFRQRNEDSIDYN